MIFSRDEGGPQPIRAAKGNEADLHPLLDIALRRLLLPHSGISGAAFLLRILLLQLSPLRQEPRPAS